MEIRTPVNVSVQGETHTNSPPLRWHQARIGLTLLPPVLAMFFLSLVSEPWARGQAYSWTTIAGSGARGSADGTNSAAGFYEPAGLAVDSAGNIYVTDKWNFTIRKIVPAGTNWVVSTIAGSVGVAGSRDGTNSQARFDQPTGVAVDSGGSVYVADRANDTIRKLTPVGTNWWVFTIAGSANGPGSQDGVYIAAHFNLPNGISVDGSGNMFVADGGNDTVRRMVQVEYYWAVSTIAGVAGSGGSADGTNRGARFIYPSGAAPDNSGNVYVTDQNNSTIRKLAPSGTNWVVSTIAGLAPNYGTADGTNSAARFFYPGGLAVDSSGNIYVADMDNNAVRKVSPSGTNWVVSTIGGICAGSRGLTDGIGSAARFNGPNGVALDSRGNVYVADQFNHAIRRGIPLPVAQTPTLTNDTLTLNWGVAVGQILQVQYTTDLGQPNWTNLGDQLVCTNCTMKVPDSVTGGAQRFYRVLVMP